MSALLFMIAVGLLSMGVRIFQNDPAFAGVYLAPALVCGINALFLFKGANWARYLLCIGYLLGSIGLLVLKQNPFHFLGFVAGGVLLYFLLFTHRTNRFFTGVDAQYESRGAPGNTIRHPRRRAYGRR